MKSSLKISSTLSLPLLTGGTGAQHVADLVNLGAVHIPRAGVVAASELLFPEALR